MQVFDFPFAAMASRCELRLLAENAAQAQTWAQLAQAEVARIEAKYSRYRADSVIGRINTAAGGAPVTIDQETAALLAYADTLYTSSDGLFDPTSGILRRAWNFKQARLPDASELAPLLPLINWPGVERSPGQIRLPHVGMELDFGGFGKEYAADRAATLLQAQGARHGYVNLGGDLRILGPQQDGRPWQIGIADPRQADATIASIPVSQGALTTSGDYERFFELAGRRYCHILNPRSGHSVQHWRSVSVLAPVAIAAGSYATLAMLKEEAGLAFLQASGLPFLAVDQHGQIWRQGETEAVT